MSVDPYDMNDERERIRLQATIDQHEAGVMEMVRAVLAHWTNDDCPASRQCLGPVSHQIAIALAHNGFPAAVDHANELQGAIGIIARTEWDRSHPVERQPGQNFESCPAATGEADPVACQQFPDGAHRCGVSRTVHLQHICTCGTTWSSAAVDTGDPTRFRGETK